MLYHGFEVAAELRWQGQALTDRSLCDLARHFRKYDQLTIFPDAILNDSEIFSNTLIKAALVSTSTLIYLTVYIRY